MIVNMRLAYIIKLVLSFEYDNFSIFFITQKTVGGNNVRTYVLLSLILPFSKSYQ